jgi:hypothetical protein
MALKAGLLSRAIAILHEAVVGSAIVGSWEIADAVNAGLITIRRATGENRRETE